MIAVVDYGMGNLHSIAKALEYIGEEVAVTSHEGALREAERLVLPGVGAFGECMRNLRATGLVDALEQQVLVERKPFLGICVGMQLLAREGLEHGIHQGLGWVDGRVVPLDGSGVRIPHTGWTDVTLVEGAARSPVAEIRAGEAFYFNHSFHLVPEDEAGVAGTAEHGQRIVASIHQENIVATQFHPEKSQQAGLEFLAGFADWDPSGD